MGEAREPLLNIKNGNASDPKFTSENFHQMSFEITQAGYAVLSAKSDFVEMNGIDSWLGGVHFLGKDVWRWDDLGKKLTCQ